MPNLDKINSLTESEAEAAFKQCCGSRNWASTMSKARPFKSETNLYQVAEDVWDALEPSDWLEAFAHHPRIGEKAATAWAAQEQSGTHSAKAETLEALRLGNVEYEKKFGFVFLICATGKSADKMLASLRARLPNRADEELPIAAAEQKKITRLRLEKLLKLKD